MSDQYTSEDIKKARAIIDAANQARPKSDRIEIAGFEIDENDEIVATSNLLVDVALVEWPRALDALEKSRALEHWRAIQRDDEQEDRIEQEDRKWLWRRLAARLFRQRDHQRKRAEAWREAALAFERANDLLCTCIEQGSTKGSPCEQCRAESDGEDAIETARQLDKEANDE